MLQILSSIKININFWTNTFNAINLNMEKTQNFANAIKQLRKSKGITLDQISDACKIKKNYFEKMEAGDFSFKPNIYIKLFLIEYLKYIDINKAEAK